MSASRTGTVVQEPPGSHPIADVRPSQFLVRTSQFLKKVSNIRGARRKSGDNEGFAAYERSTRSMDFTSKDYAVLSGQHAAIHIDRTANTPSPNGISSEERHGTRSHGPTAVSESPSVPVSSETVPASMEAGHLRTTSDSVLGSRQSSSQLGIMQLPREVALDGPPGSTQLPSGKHIQESSTFEGPTSANATTNGIASVPAAAAGAQVAASQALPIRTVSLGAAALSSIAAGSSSSETQSPPSPGELSRSLSDRRNLAPRLATLPPPMMASFTAKGSTRLTPSVVSRQPPMPILNLPMLPPVTSAQPVTLPRQQTPLRSIPALPMRGPSESEQEADHDNALLEDEDEEEEDDADASPGLREADAAASDEEDAEDNSEMLSPSHDTPRSRGDRLPGLPQVDTSRLFRSEVTEQNRETLYFTPPADGLPTPLVRRPGSSSSAATDYFTSKKSDKEPNRSNSPSRTPRPADYVGSPSLRTPTVGNGPQILSLSSGSPRPSLYHLGSRSMVDLLSASTKRAKDKMSTPSIGPEIIAERRGSKVLPGPPTIQEDEQCVVPQRVEPEEDMSPASPALRRQRSLPTYKMSSDPPPYPSFHPRLEIVVQPRDEEGRERLPSYSNAIYLSAIMPRKVEFTAPGVQAKDRKWRRVLCILEGTAFKVYKPPPGTLGVSAIEEWWEKKVGVGDITVANGAAVTQSGIRVSAVRGRGPEGERPGKTEESEEPRPAAESVESEPPPLQHPPPSRSKLHLAASLLHPTRSSHSNRNTTTISPTNRHSNSHTQPRPRASMDVQSQEDHSTISVVTRSSTDERSSRHSGHMSASNSRSAGGTPPSSSDSSSSFFSRSRVLPGSASSDTSQPNSAKSIPEPSQKDLLACYTLQHAESGLASDYTKRKNVIRLRMEGEQFLLQAQDVASVIDWIEGIQAATNIALDLDERPMPKGPMFPRRRRRRARAGAGASEQTRSLAIRGVANPPAHDASS